MGHSTSRVAMSYGNQKAMADRGDTHRGRGWDRNHQLPVRPGLAHQHGFVHAGIVILIVDTGCGFAA